MNYSKALIQFAFVGLVLPIIGIFLLLMLRGQLEQQVMLRADLENKLEMTTAQIAATHQQLAVYEEHRKVWQQIEGENLRRELPRLFTLLDSVGLTKQNLQYRVGFSDEGGTGNKYFLPGSITLEITGRYIPLLQASYALESAFPSLVASSFTIKPEALDPLHKDTKQDPPLSLHLSYNVMAFPPLK